MTNSIEDLNEIFDHAKQNAKSDCRKCAGSGQYQYTTHGTPQFTICEKCCKHDLGWWKLGDLHGRDAGKWCCRAGCGYVIPFNPDEVVR